MNHLQKKAKKRFRPLGQKGGGTGFLLVFLIFFATLGIFMVFLNIVKSQHRMAASNRDETVALQLADSAMDQMLSKLRTNRIHVPLEYVPKPTITPLIQGQVPMTIAVPVGIPTIPPFPTPTSYIMAHVRIDYDYVMPTPTVGQTMTPVPNRDIEGNVKFKMETVVDYHKAVGTNTKQMIRRGIASQFTTVNFGRYMSFTTSNDSKSFNKGSFNGPYHCNGDATLQNTCDWNNQILSWQSGQPANPFFDNSYTTMVWGNITLSSGATYRSQNNQRAYGTGGSFTLLPNAACPLGTWFDKAHGAFKVTPPDIPVEEFMSAAQIIIDVPTMLNSFSYKLQGAGLVGAGSVTLPTCPVTNAGITDPAIQAVRINLSALARGYNNTPVDAGLLTDYQTGDGFLGPTDTIAMQNYDKALSSKYGLVIYVNGDAAVWGMLPDDTLNPANNEFKKVTIAASGEIEIFGDVLVSGSPYFACNGVCTGACASKCASNDIDPDPTVDNPHQDGIAILSGNGSIRTDAYASADGSYFVVNGAQDAADMRIEAMLYAPHGYTGGANDADGPGGTCPDCGNQAYAGGGNTRLKTFTYHGSITVKQSGYLPSITYDRFYDPNLKFNISPIIPSATIVSSWQEKIDPASLQ